MKKFLLIASFMLIAIFAMSTTVYAAEAASEAELEAALAGTDATITLKGNVELTKSLEVGRTVTLDLNGFNITAKDGMTDDSLIIVLHGGALTVEGNGSISATNDNASTRIAVKMTKGGNVEAFYKNNAAKLVLNSGVLEGKSFGISGNGNPDRINTIVEINGGEVKGGTTGIYHPQEGKLTINAGTVEGKTGIEMRSGDLLVTGGSIVGTGSPASSTGNLSGTTTVGAGIAVAQHTTEKNISVVVKGGNVQGYSALYESNPQSNTTMDKVILKIEGGNFEAINNGTDAIYSEDKTEFVTGGTFSTNVEAYIDANNADIKSVKDETTGEYYVGVESKITVKAGENGKASAAEKAVEGQPVKITATANEGYKVGTIKVTDAAGKEVKVVNGEFLMPGSEVTVEVTFEKLALDKTPATGSIDTIMFVGMLVSAIAIVGIVMKKQAMKNLV